MSGLAGQDRRLGAGKVWRGMGVGRSHPGVLGEAATTSSFLAGCGPGW